jgi:hypothetical protein
LSLSIIDVSIIVTLGIIKIGSELFSSQYGYKEFLSKLDVSGLISMTSNIAS